MCSSSIIFIYIDLFLFRELIGNKQAPSQILTIQTIDINAGVVPGDHDHDFD